MNHKPIPSMLRLLIGMNVYALLYSAVYLAMPGQEGSLALWTNVSPILVSLFAALTALLAWRSSPSGDRPTWQWLSIGLSLWSAAEMLWAYLSLGAPDTVPYPSLADVLWVSGYVPIGVAIVLHFRRNRAQLNRRKLVLALLGGGLLAAIVIRALVEPMTTFNATVGRGLESALDLIYPVLDVLLAVGGFLMMQASDRRHWWHPWLFIGSAMTVWAFSDVWFSILSWTGAYGLNWFSALTVDIPYTMAYLIFGTGCLQGIALVRSAPLNAQREGV